MFIDATQGTSLSLKLILSRITADPKYIAGWLASGVATARRINFLPRVLFSGFFTVVILKGEKKIIRLT